MAKKSSISLQSTDKLIQIAVGLFFITLGILEIAAYNSGASELTRSVSRAFGGKSDIMSIIFAILELVSGLIILGSIFVTVQQKLVFIASFAIGIFWLIKIIMAYFMSNFMEPDFLVWLNRLAIDLLVLASVWMINRQSN
ncbi:MAG: hypothetical protein KAH95_16210 [Spirochaetales bacterium]|nr:hypothetical protein [Spirochaetales bacterium]